MKAVSFKAYINIDRSKLQSALNQDKYFFNTANRERINGIINQVESLAAMKEKSTVNIMPRLDNNQLNLICTVKDKTGKITDVISQRSARKMSSDKDFAKSFIYGISTAIKNVNKARKIIKQIKKAIKQSKTLEDAGFTSNIHRYLLTALKKDYNPQKRIISILKQIEKENPGETNVVSIEFVKSKMDDKTKQTHINPYFCINNSKGKKMIPLPKLIYSSIRFL